MTGDGDALRERVRRDVDRRLGRLEECFGPFPVVAETVENDPDRFERGREMAADGWRGDAGARVEGADGRVLLIRHAGSPDAWGVPGGGHVPGETFPETARREVVEETGVEVDLVGVRRARRKEFVHAEDPDRRLEMLTVWFDARAEDPGPLDVGDDEVLEARWFDEPPDSVPEFLADPSTGGEP